MGFGERVRGAWEVLASVEAGRAKKSEAVQAAKDAGRERKTVPLPSILTPYPYAGQTGNQASMPKPTAVNLRRFSETPVARRAINLVKDRIASMDWQVRVRRGYDAASVPDAEEKMQALRRALEEPNSGDSFRTLWEQVLEDVLVGGFGAVEMNRTGDVQSPFQLFAVDGRRCRSIRSGMGRRRRRTMGLLRVRWARMR